MVERYVPAALGSGSHYRSVSNRQLGDDAQPVLHHQADLAAQRLLAADGRERQNEQTRPLGDGRSTTMESFSFPVPLLVRVPAARSRRLDSCVAIHCSPQTLAPLGVLLVCHMSHARPCRLHPSGALAGRSRLSSYPSIAIEISAVTVLYSLVWTVRFAVARIV